ncbi:MAG: hypothetical protein ACJASC_002893 [Limimaricola cinnabarinus]
MVRKDNLGKDNIMRKFVKYFALYKLGRKLLGGRRRG